MYGLYGPEFNAAIHYGYVQGLYNKLNLHMYVLFEPYQLILTILVLSPIVRLED